MNNGSRGPWPVHIWNQLHLESPRQARSQRNLSRPAQHQGFTGLFNSLRLKERTRSDRRGLASTPLGAGCPAFLSRVSLSSSTYNSKDSIKEAIKAEPQELCFPPGRILEQNKNA